MKIKLLNLNLWDGGKLFPQILTFIEKENADILTLQEANDGRRPNLPNHLRSLVLLQEKLPDFHSHFAPEFLINRPEGKIEMGNAVFSRFPISSGESVFFDVPYSEYDYQPHGGDFSQYSYNLQHIVVEADTVNLNIFNIHGVWGTDGLDNPRRLRMSQIITEQVKGKENVILAGDFNVRPETKTIRMVENHLINVFKDQLISTFNMRRKTRPHYATTVVDAIFTSKNIKILGKTCPDVDISDHRPFLVTFQIKRTDFHS